MSKPYCFLNVIGILFILQQCPIVFCQFFECPNLPDHPFISCRSIIDWDEFIATITSNRSDDAIVFCSFNIQKPARSNVLVISKPLTLVCLKPGTCIINLEQKSETGIMKLRGLAKVSMSGFVMQGYDAVFDAFSGIHVTYQTEMKQTFCECIFRGFRGSQRGTALRSELNTDVDLINCHFDDNEARDIGTIFNRGEMMIASCMFERNTGRGNSVGASRGSVTTLYGNTFIDNAGGVPLFFHDFDFYDAGGNTSMSNGLCNGIFVHKGHKCLEFLTDLSETIASPAPTYHKSSIAEKIQEVKSCHRALSRETVCVIIKTFFDLKSVIEGSSGDVFFCPFTISPDSSDIFTIKNITIQSNVNLICKVDGQCHIEGARLQIRIIGPAARVFIQGFVFEEASVSAIHILPSATDLQTFCDCKFVRNQGKGRGAGILAEPSTTVAVMSCHFELNFSSDLGGAIFNRGTMMISESTFYHNNGRGGAIGNAPKAEIRLKDNIFRHNDGLFPIFLHDESYVDFGGNLVEGKSFCNGMYIDRGRSKCISFLETLPSTHFPSPAPTHSSDRLQFDPFLFTKAPRGGIGYFNYDLNDVEYGPNGWGEVKDNEEFKRFQDLQGTLDRSLTNKCNLKTVNQSPIDLCESKINHDCKEYHQTRTHSGNITLGDEQVTAQILSSKLRLKYYPDRPPLEGPYPPEADYANNWNGYAEVNHIDIKIPSEHTLCGTRYPAEYSIYIVHPKRRQTVVMSILLALEKNDKPNSHLQLAIDEWQKVYDDNENRCKKPRKRDMQIKSKSEIDVNTSTFRTRNLKDKTPFGTGGWNPFHDSLVKSIYHWGYWGSLTEPPCSTFVAWRVVTQPAFISKGQLDQMKQILFTNRNEDCVYTSVNHKLSVARPSQPNRGRLLYKCTRNDYVSDKEKAEMREKTGNPNWCC